MKMRNRQTMCDLPQHLVFSIFEHLPVKSLLRFRSASKTFYSLVHKSNFVTSHLKNSCSTHTTSDPNKHHNTLFYFVVYPKLTRLMLYNDTTLSLSPFAVHDFHHQSFMVSTVVGHCNGVICLVDSKYTTCYLWNPLINKTIKHDLQKQVRAKVYAASVTSNKGDSDHRWRIYSINNLPRKRQADETYANCILSYHVEDEVFQELALPPSLPPFGALSLTEFKGMLCVCVRVRVRDDGDWNSERTNYSIWVYGERESSWLPFSSMEFTREIVLKYGEFFDFTTLERPHLFLKVVGLKNNGEQVWIRRCSCLIPPGFLNPKTLELEQLKSVEDNGDYILRQYLFSGTYMKSLGLMDVQDENILQ
ncbi:F-box protein CPR30-like [Senna tora]|uniref:F-box protein CPR30-like n=1 Tax=Senna tora TaxID=362788 RepID=A0A834TJ50_9FABA|nr:F-box protein CPR30-like [Senna tora]